jgi:hypothetical protein
MAIEAQNGDDQTTQPRNPSTAGALAALRRAAIKAQHRALQTTGSFPVWKDGEVVYETEIVGFSDEEIKEVLGESAVTNIGGYVRPPKPR